MLNHSDTMNLTFIPIYSDLGFSYLSGTYDFAARYVAFKFWHRIVVSCTTALQVQLDMPQQRNLAQISKMKTLKDS